MIFLFQNLLGNFQKNIEEIQNSIIRGVYERSNGEYKIDKQDYDTLNIIMRSTFLQYSLNNTENMKEEILSLNKIVLITYLRIKIS